MAERSTTIPYSREKAVPPCFETLLGSNIDTTSCSKFSKISLQIHLGRTSNLFLAGGDGFWETGEAGKTIELKRCQGKTLAGAMLPW